MLPCVTVVFETFLRYTYFLRRLMNGEVFSRHYWSLLLNIQIMSAFFSVSAGVSFQSGIL